MTGAHIICQTSDAEGKLQRERRFLKTKWSQIIPGGKKKRGERRMRRMEKTVKILKEKFNS